MELWRYDRTDPKAIEEYGRGLIGKSPNDIYNMARSQGFSETDYVSRHANEKYKGGIGNLIEECYFGNSPNNNSEADFPEAGVELKVIPYKENKNGYVAKERLVLNMIDYMEVIKESDFEHSHVWAKNKRILLIWYLHIDGQNDIYSIINYVQLFTPPEDDLEIIRSDYVKILTKIRLGKADELSEGDTFYLGACTKSSNSRTRRVQPCSSELAKPRAFCFKNSYMTYVLNHYII